MWKYKQDKTQTLSSFTMQIGEKQGWSSNWTGQLGQCLYHRVSITA